MDVLAYIIIRILYIILCTAFINLIILIFVELRKQDGILSSKSLNFTPVDKVSLFNTDSKCELFYPFIHMFLSGIFSYLIFKIIDFSLKPIFSPNFFKEPIQQLPFAIQVFVALFTLDICLYVRHRFTHTFLWSFHGVHHSAHKISWLTYLRVHPVDSLVMTLIQSSILYFIGFTAEVMAVAGSINGYWNIFVHSNIHLDFPKPFKYIFGSPNFHRWHHATDTEAHNTNYCIMFSCIDYVMGTYYCPDNRLPDKYGSSIKTLDDYQNTNIIKELLYPFVIEINKIKKRFKNKKNTAKEI